MKRLISILASALILITGLGINPAAAADSTFACGAYATYTVDEDGLLIYGNCDADLVVLDSSVTEIVYASMNGWRIKSLTIPASVTTIWDSAFYGLPDLETITVDVSNSHFKTVNGVLMNYQENRIIYYPGASPATSYTVPDSVVTIDNRAFNCLKYLEVVNIPETTTAIGPQSFGHCGYSAPSLQEINVAETNPTYKSIDHVLFSKDGTRLLNYPGNYASPNYVIPEGTTTISDSAFSNTTIQSVTFPSTLITIEQYAFSYTTSLESVGEFPASYRYSPGNISPFIGASKVPSFSVSSANPDFASIDGVMFSKDESVLYEYPGGRTNSSYRIPGSVETVTSQAFASEYLKTMAIPSTVQTLGYEYVALDYLVFEGNSSITSVQGINNVQHIIYCGSANPEITRFATSMYKSVECPASPTNVVAIATSETSASISFTAPASDGGEVIETYTATSSPGSITGQLFQAAAGTITVEGLTPGTDYTFTVTASNSIGTSLPSSASASITTLGEAPVSTDCFIVVGGVLTDGTGCVGALTISNTVESIGDNAFYEISGLTSVTIPSSVTSIGSNAFAYTGLTSVTIPSTVTFIGIDAFIGTGNLASFTVDPLNPNYKDIDGVLFNKLGTELIAYPASKAGTSYGIPNGVTSIVRRSFFGATTLTSIAIPSSVTTIGNQTFYATGNLNRITIPSSVTSIDYNAFQSSGIETITITSSATSIADDAFLGANALRTVRFLGDVAPTGVSSSLSAPATASAVINPGAAGFTPDIDGKWNGLMLVTAGPELLATEAADSVDALIIELPATSSISTANSSAIASARAAFNALNVSAKALVTTLATLVAAEEKLLSLNGIDDRAAERAAAAKRESEKRSARAEISNKYAKLEKVTLETLTKAEIPGITNKNIDAVQAEILTLPAEARADIDQVLKVARKFEIVAYIASDRPNSIYPSRLVEIGLIPADSKSKSAITQALKNLPASERSTYADIKVAIENEMARIQVRKDRLASLIARVSVP
jgi:hypothetical protein